MTDEQIFKKILDCSFAIHTALGPGLLESSYEECLYYELKAIEGNLHDVHLAQILTYMKLSDCRLGLLVNFNVKSLQNGIKRMIL